MTDGWGNAPTPGWGTPGAAPVPPPRSLPPRRGRRVARAVRWLVVLALLGGGGVVGVHWWQDRQADQAIIDGKRPTVAQVRDGLSDEAARATLRSVCATGTGVAGFAAYAPETIPQPVETSGPNYPFVRKLTTTGAVHHPVAVVYVDQATTAEPLAVEYSDGMGTVVPQLSELQLVGCVTDAPNTYCDEPFVPPTATDRIQVTVRDIATGAEVTTLFVNPPLGGVGTRPATCDARVEDLDDASDDFELALAIYAKTR